MVDLSDRLEPRLLRLIDWAFSRRPRPHPGIERLQSCRIISHRGEHDNRRVFENTLVAFDAAVAQGVWGIEFDLRWTRDLAPVVIHDADLRRLFGRDLRVGDCTLRDLKIQCPRVPTLAEVVGRYGRKVHLMLEIKAASYPDRDRQNRALGDVFAALTPGRDFHLLSLAPELFRLINFTPAAAFVPVARLNFAGLRRLAMQEGYGGVAGHYALVGDSSIQRLHAAGQKVGTGYPRSRNCLFREIHRGVDWIFSNHAGEVQRLIRRLQDSNFDGSHLPPIGRASVGPPPEVEGLEKH
jgi:glycerophosphoryl diester phosphodiesterase